jgi:regulator of nonsense transcripts 1
MGLAVSLFEKLMAAGLQPHLLQTQYRMHPHIAHFPSTTFYDGRLDNGITADDRTLAWSTRTY